MMFRKYKKAKEELLAAEAKLQEVSKTLEKSIKEAKTLDKKFSNDLAHAIKTGKVLLIDQNEDILEFARKLSNEGIEVELMDTMGNRMNLKPATNLDKPKRDIFTQIGEL